MESDRKDRRTNPFSIGLMGLLLLVAGCVGLHYLNAPNNVPAILSRMQQATRAQGDRTDPVAAQLVARAERYYRAHRYGILAAQVLFFAGVSLVVAAATIWFQQAQQPEPAAESDEESVVTVPSGSEADEALP